MDREENINLDSLSQAKERAYNGNDLGAVYSVEGTTFKVWAPSATEVMLRRVPEGLYATNPHDGNLRITEFKQMVQSLHEENIGVIMDVVFNHVGGNAYTSWFEYTVPGYYFWD